MKFSSPNWDYYTTVSHSSTLEVDLLTNNAKKSETLVTFEYTSNAVSQPHSILFVGGLGDGLATTSYTADLVQGLQQTPWSFFTLNLASSYQSWGLGSLDDDTDKIATCLQYIKEYKSSKYGEGKSKIVLMGHSTGSQCTVHYLYRPNPHTSKHLNRPAIDGAIMQAPVSDREAILWILRHGFGDTTPEKLREVYNKIETLAKEAVKTNPSFDTILPLKLTSEIYPADTPLSARRFLSLASPDSPENPSEDDLFSSDLRDDQLKRTFGLIQERQLLKGRFMALISGADASVPDWVDKNKLLARWKNAVDHDGKFSIWDSERSGIIPGASHALSNDDQAEPRKFLVKRVTDYLNTVIE